MRSGRKKRRTRTRRHISYSRAAAVLRYDPLSGLLFWKQQRGRAAEGQPAGSVSVSRRGGRQRKVHIDGHKYGFGPIAWLLMTGELPDRIVDFRNDNALDTRWCNLVLATPSERTLHSSPRKNSRSGAAGVTWRNSKWQARIVLDGKEKFLGVFGDVTEALQARRAAIQQRVKHRCNNGLPFAPST
jgi:hypothetical protein